MNFLDRLSMRFFHALTDQEYHRSRWIAAEAKLVKAERALKEIALGMTAEMWIDKAVELLSLPPEKRDQVEVDFTIGALRAGNIASRRLAQHVLGLDLTPDRKKS